MTSVSQVNLPASFRKSAAQNGVAESDFLYMAHMGIVTHEAFALRVHSKDALEDFLKDHICPSAAYSDPDQGLLVFDRQPALPWREFKLSEDSAAIRKWLLSKEMCRVELEKLASGEDSSRSKLKLASHVAMEERAVAKGMPSPASDTERPALYAINHMVKNYQGPGAAYEYLSWEVFLTLDEEGRFSRAGKMPKVKTEVVLSKDSRLALSEKDGDEPLVDHVTDLETMRTRLEIRARASSMVEVASYSVYRALNDRYFGKLLAQVPEGMRQPTVQEVRRFDRALHQELHRWLSRDMGTLESGLQFYLDDDGQALWRLLDPVIRSLPDQGIERAPKGKKRKGDEDGGDRKSRDSPEPLSRKSGPSAPKLKQCLVCKKRHTPLCQLPENFRRQQRAERRTKKNEAKAKAAPNTGERN